MYIAETLEELGGGSLTAGRLENSNNWDLGFVF